MQPRYTTAAFSFCYTTYMTVPNVDTFEHDIADEIKRKEAGFTDIASASGDVKNDIPVKHSAAGLVFLGILFVALVLSAIGGLVYYYNKTPDVVPTNATSSTGTDAQVTPEIAEALQKISPTLAQATAGNLGKVTPAPFGYSIEILNYSPVFSYMLKNEDAFAHELAYAVGASSASSTDFIVFTDETMSNQNMRVGTVASSTVVYAFVDTKTLLIASSTQGILSMRGILSQ